MNRAAQHALEIDAKDKHHAQGLDDRMQQLRNGSAGIGYYPGIESIDNTYAFFVLQSFHAMCEKSRVLPMT